MGRQRDSGLGGELLQPWRRLGRPHPTQIRRLYTFLEQITLARPIQPRLEAAATGSFPALGGRGVCGAKRIRSIYLPWMKGTSPGLSTTIPPERPGLALHYQCRDYAPLQTCPPPAGQTSLPRTTNGGWKPLPHGQGSSSAPRLHASSFFKPSTIRLGTGFESSVR